MRSKIAAVVVLYNPDKNILKNIDSYINSVDKVYVIDNSEDKDTILFDNLKS